MSDDFADLQGVSEGDSPGQQADSGTTKPAKLNLHETPEWRAAQSAYDRQVAEAKRRAEELERRARLAESKLQQYEQLANVDDETAAYLASQARIAEQEVELAMYREQEARRAQEEQQRQAAQQWRTAWTQAAQQNGVNVYDARFQQALDSGDASQVMSAMAKLVTEKATQQPAPTPQQPVSHSALPPTGGSPATVQALVEEFRTKKSKLRQGDLESLFQLRKEYRGKIPYEELMG